jgi:hypothetical protein
VEDGIGKRVQLVATPYTGVALPVLYPYKVRPFVALRAFVPIAVPSPEYHLEAGCIRGISAVELLYVKRFFAPT